MSTAPRLYIIIVGGGKVGFHLAKELVESNYEVLVIEQDPVQARAIGEELGDIVLEGDGCEASVHEQAGTRRANMLLAVTGDDQANLVACQVAKALFNVERTIARINNPKNEAFFRMLDEIDITVSATTAIMAHIEQGLPTTHHLIQLLEVKGSGIELVEVRVPDDSRVVGQPLKSISLPYQSMICAVLGPDGLPHVASPDTIIHAEDVVIAFTLHENEEALREALMAPAPVRSF